MCQRESESRETQEIEVALRQEGDPGRDGKITFRRMDRFQVRANDTGDKYLWMEETNTSTLQTAGKPSVRKRATLAKETEACR